MDLKQRKLTKSEWESTEQQVEEHDKFILSVINQGYENVNIRTNMNSSMFSIIKIDRTSENEVYLYEKYFKKIIIELTTKYSFTYKQANNKTKQPRKIDVMRIDNMDENIQNKRATIFEYTLLDLAKAIMKSRTNYEYYTLSIIRNSTVLYTNKYVLDFIDILLTEKSHQHKIHEFITSANKNIEQNPYLSKYEDVVLYEHQKQLFTIFKNPDPKLVLYVAPTGTGKTLSPIGLANQYRIIFICVSRHVGLALAKSAIAVEKKVAFAFGCETTSDIRLHYFAAAEYSINRRTGGIFKVDNSVGNKVEIMITDVESYLVAMRYMLAFNTERDIVTYWDEPTITMDYDTHELHTKINENWKENQISKMVLSCATLPFEEEIAETIMDFKAKFENAEVHSISSFDYKKSISLINMEGQCVLPHMLFQEFRDLQNCVSHCDKNRTLLRYFDLQKIVDFVCYVNSYKMIDDEYLIENYFPDVKEIKMDSIKYYYLNCLKHIKEEHWSAIFNYMNMKQDSIYDNSNKLRKTISTDKVEPKTIVKNQSMDLNSTKLNGLFLTTKDAQTLTHGPTIFMANDVNKIAQFYVKTAQIPQCVYDNLLSNILKNNQVCDKIGKIEMKLDDKQKALQTSDKETSKKTERQEENNPEIKKLNQEIDNLKTQLVKISLERNYIPNTNEHQKKWHDKTMNEAYAPNISDEHVEQIAILDVSNDLKMLLLMGIGTFDNNSDVRYLEIMKELAYEQKLYIIIASTDYIYGTNYMFSHGYVGKDLTNMTQQKIIQAMGRIGRNKNQQNYTIRFRDNTMFMKLFSKQEFNQEAVNMNKLFSS